jgi:hypothetical protein
MDKESEKALMHVMGGFAILVLLATLGLVL